MLLTIDRQKERTIIIQEDDFHQNWMECTNEIYQAERLIYCVDIDGQVFYNEYEEYIQDHLQVIQNIHITTHSRLESINETYASLNEYLTKFIPAMDSIADKMYGDVTPEVWSQFATGLEGLQWIVSSFEFLQYLHSGDHLNSSQLFMYCAELEKIITELDGYLGENNLVGVGDLLKYELLPLLEKYQTGAGH